LHYGIDVELCEASKAFPGKNAGLK
jgi:hypothetical protein